MVSWSVLITIQCTILYVESFARRFSPVSPPALIGENFIMLIFCPMLKIALHYWRIFFPRIFKFPEYKGRWVWCGNFSCIPFAMCYIHACTSMVYCHMTLSLPIVCASHTCHTPQSEGKRGLVTVHTTSCSGDRIWSRPIRFEIWIYCLAMLYWRRTCIQSAPHYLRLSVTFFFVIIAFRRNN